MDDRRAFPIARVTRELGINDGTLGNWVAADPRRRDGGNSGPGEFASPAIAVCGGWGTIAGVIMHTD